jgi:hypothetical protein
MYHLITSKCQNDFGYNEELKCNCLLTGRLKPITSTAELIRKLEDYNYYAPNNPNCYEPSPEEERKSYVKKVISRLQSGIVVDAFRLSYNEGCCRPLIYSYEATETVPNESIADNTFRKVDADGIDSP